MLSESIDLDLNPKILLSMCYTYIAGHAEVKVLPVCLDDVIPLMCFNIETFLCITERLHPKGYFVAVLG